MQKSPWNPASHPVRHVPFIREHCWTSRQCPHVPMQSAPNDLMSHSIKQSHCELFYWQEIKKTPWFELTLYNKACYVFDKKINKIKINKFNAWILAPCTVPSWQYSPFQPGWHPEVQRPFTCSQPLQVLLHSSEQFWPKNPGGQAK